MLTPDDIVNYPLKQAVRGYFSAYDAETGARAWRFYTVPGDPSKPFEHPELEAAAKTWSGEWWKVGGGGGTVWDAMAYDPELDLIYYGTANPGPWNAEQRPGDNKWTSGTFARDPDTGEAVWFYQWSPHDLFDHDGTNEQILIDLPMGGTTRKVLLRPERNGYMYVMDRATGEVLSATPFVHITSSTGVDLKTGRLIPVKEKEPREGIVVRDICPSSPGAKDWNPSSFSPATGLLYDPGLLYTYLSGGLFWLLGFSEALGRWLFQSPTSHYKVGLAFLAENLLRGLAAPMFGALSDRIGRRPLLIGASLATAAVLVVEELSDAGIELGVSG